MSLIQNITRACLLAILLQVAPVWMSAQEQDADESVNESDPEAVAATAPDTEMVDRIVFRDETTDQVLDLLERLTGRSIIRPQALPAATFTFNSQQPMTRDEAILALTSMLSINGIGVTPMGDLFLKVVPLARVRSEAPEFLTKSTLELPASGRVVSKMLHLEFLDLEEIQTQLNLMITPGSGSIIPFPKSSALLVTDTVSNLQAMEQLLAKVDRPYDPRTETHFYPIQHARAEELVGQIESFAGQEGFPQLSGGTIITADERSNQIILVADPRQVEYFETLIEKLDVRADLATQNEVLFLKHANAVEVASLLTQVAGGQLSGGGAGSGTGSSRRQRAGSGQQSRSGEQNRSSQRRQMGSGQSSSQPSVPRIPGQNSINAQSVEAAQATLEEVAPNVSESDFSETLTIFPDERSNAIVVSGTRQDVALITELIEKIDIILAQVRIEVFIAEVTLNDTDGRGIEAFGFEYTEGDDRLDFNASGPGYVLSRENLKWDVALDAAKTNSEIKVLSVPTIVTTHNMEANILVGERRPIITGSISDSRQISSSIRSQIQYEDIGIELFVLPLIGTDGTIQLEIEQNVDDVVDTVTIDGNAQPVIGTRSATSFVSVADRETVILGGLQSTRTQEAYGRLGLLGQIPLLGRLFSYTTTEDLRTELLVFIRPTVIQTTDDAHRDAQEQIDRLSREKHIRHFMDPDTHPDPNVPQYSEEAFELREEAILRRQSEERQQRREAERAERDAEEAPPAEEETRAAPEPEPEPEAEPDETSAAEPESRDESNHLTPRRRIGAGRNL